MCILRILDCKCFKSEECLSPSPPQSEHGYLVQASLKKVGLEWKTWSIISTQVACKSFLSWLICECNNLGFIWKWWCFSWLCFILLKAILKAFLDKLLLSQFCLFLSPPFPLYFLQVLFSLSLTSLFLYSLFYFVHLNNYLDKKKKSGIFLFYFKGKQAWAHLCNRDSFLAGVVGEPRLKLIWRKTERTFKYVTIRLKTMCI